MSSNMSPTTIFYNSLNGRTCTIDLHTPISASDLQKVICDQEAIDDNLVTIYFQDRKLDVQDDKLLEWNQPQVFLHIQLPLLGGKGGFGSMLRAIGAQIEKTTNKEACRDLSGRRLRDVNIEKRFQDWISKAAERKKEQQKKKKEKLEKLRKVPKYEFKDDEYFKVRSEIPEVMDAAVEYAFKNKKSLATASATVSKAPDDDEPVASTSSGSSSTSGSTTAPKCPPIAIKRKAEQKVSKPGKKSRSWIPDEDLEVSEDEDEKKQDAQ